MITSVARKRRFPRLPSIDILIQIRLRKDVQPRHRLEPINRGQKILDPSVRDPLVWE